jgi:TonB family protein
MFQIFKILPIAIGIKIALFSAMILICFFISSCDKKDNNKNHVVKIDKDSICRQSNLKAVKDYTFGKFHLKIPRMSEFLKPYAEEFFQNDCKKEISIDQSLVLVDNMGGGKNSVDKISDSCYNLALHQLLTKEFGNDILARITQKADSLHTIDPDRYNQTPTFPGGDGALMMTLSKNIEYPSSAREAGIQGTVYLKIEVDSIGKVKNVTAMGGANRDLCNAAIEAAKRLPNFIPVTRDGKRISSSLIEPVRFVLK